MEMQTWLEMVRKSGYDASGVLHRRYVAVVGVTSFGLGQLVHCGLPCALPFKMQKGD